MNKSFKDSIDNRLSAINAPADLAAKVRSRANSSARRSFVPFRRMLAVAATISIVVVLSIGVTAANLPQLTQLFSIVGEKVQSIAQPIVQTSESNGIKMEVLAAVYSDNDAIIYLTLQDMVSSRISADVELYNFEISGIVHPFPEVLNFDAAANIATIKVTGMSREPLNGKKLTITLKTLLSHHIRNDNIDSGLTVNSIAASNPTPQLYHPKQINGSTSYFDTNQLAEDQQQSINPDYMTFIKPETSTLSLNEVPWAYVSAYGIVNNALHIQLNPNDTQGRYSNTMFALADANNVVLDDLTITTVEFGQRIEQGSHDYSDYYETAILLPEDAYEKDYKLLMRTDTYKYRVDGDWATTFLLESASIVKKADCIINMNPWEITEAIVSPISVTVKGHGQMYEYSSSAKITVNRVDGTPVQTVSTSITSESGQDGEDKIVIQEHFSLPVDIKEIASITINDITVALK